MGASGVTILLRRGQRSNGEPLVAPLSPVAIRRRSASGTGRRSFPFRLPLRREQSVAVAASMVRGSFFAVKAAAWLEEARWRHGLFSLLPVNLAVRVDYGSSSSSGGVFHSLTPAVSGCDVDGRRRHQAFPFSGESKARRNGLLCSRSQFSFMVTGGSVEG
nr:hypothetical protein Iba_chr12aCG12830 [Ipomoea batatas]